MEKKKLGYLFPAVYRKKYQFIKGEKMLHILILPGRKINPILSYILQTVFLVYVITIIFNKVLKKYKQRFLLLFFLKKNLKCISSTSHKY